MQLSTFSLITTTLFLALAGTISAQIDPKRYPFKLRVALPDPRSPPDPIWFNHYGELDPNTGDVFVDVGRQAAGIQAYLVPNPEGGILRQYFNGTKVEDDPIGYLYPLPALSTAGSQHYQLRFGAEVPVDVDGVLYADFLTIGRNCGGGCGGPTLDYDNGLEPGFGHWYVVQGPDEDEDCDGGNNSTVTNNLWKVRWVGSQSREDHDNATLPAGGVEVFIWKN